MSSTRPTTIGGSITVSDSQSLANLNIAGLPPGTTVWNEDVGAFFKLTTCARRDIVLDPTDFYDTGVFTFAAGDFTAADEGQTLVVRFDYPNAGYNANYLIDSVDSATEITVDPAPADASVEPFTGAVTVVDTGPSEADVVVSVQAGAIFGVVWRKVTVAEASHADTADVADTADAPTDAADFTATLDVATVALKGLQSAADKTFEDSQQTDWFALVRQFVTGKDATIVSMPIQTDFQTLDGITVPGQSGTGSAALGVASTGGEILVATGATAASVGKITSKDGVAFVADVKVTHWAVAIRVKGTTNPAAGTAGTRYIYVSDQSTPNASVILGIDRSVSTANYSLTVGAAAGTSTGIPIDTSYHTWIVINDGTNTRAYHNFNTTHVATAASSNIAAAPCHYVAMALNGDQAVNNAWRADKLALMSVNP